MCIGILALQGGFACHAEHLETLGVNWKYVRQPSELSNIRLLIIPGGESSTLLKLMQAFAWDVVIKQFYQQGHWILGTCAGAILLAQSVTPAQASLGLIDIDIERNAYGRQLDSFIGSGEPQVAELGTEPFECVFIRAPKIKRIGSEVKVLLQHNNEIVMVQQERIFAATFHPELSVDLRIHKLLSQVC